MAERERERGGDREPERVSEDERDGRGTESVGEYPRGKRWEREVLMTWLEREIALESRISVRSKKREMVERKRE